MAKPGGQLLGFACRLGNAPLEISLSFNANEWRGRVMRTLTHVLAVYLVLGALAVVETTADPMPSCNSDAMIVFDASGSMAASDFPDGAPSRIDRARQALSRFLPKVSKVRNLGLVVYGPGKNRDACRNVALRFKPMPDAGERISAEVARLAPDGRTPLTRAVEVAAASFGPSSGQKTIVLLTDGEETCAGDPCGLARELKAAHPNIIVHVIGYKLLSQDGSSPVSGAKCLADETGGYNLTADTTEELADALAKTLGCEDIVKREMPADFRMAAFDRNSFACW